MRISHLVLGLAFNLIIISNCTIAQVSGEAKKLIERGDRFFKIRNYAEAITNYKEAVDLGANDPLTFYNLGVSFYSQQEVNEKIKAIPYLEKASASKSDQVPERVLFYLGKVYHMNNDINPALKSYEDYKKGIESYDTKKIKEVDREIEICRNALMLISQSRQMDIERIETPISSEYTEYNPVVSTDESVMAFTALRPNTDRSGPEFIEEIYISYKSNSGQWSDPEKVPVRTQFNVGTAGISADGQNMIIFIGGADNTGNLYTIDRSSGDSWSDPAPIGSPINSRFLESTASITPDGKTIYFASNRPGTYGGTDIYRSNKLSNGSWDEPKNLGKEVNTKYDDDAPFIHPDGKTLFFTSEGHNSMGGRDIFKTVLLGEKWSEPINMGYPINTTTDDNYFTLTADAKRGFFSSDRKGGLGGQDIYSLTLPEEELNIPLTLVKGKILAGETLQPVPTKILVVDKESDEKIDYVYNPDPATGNYLIIFPPGKNYDMIIESEGYMPYTLNINIPNQTYFYELFQQIELKPIKQFDVVVGQEVTVKNAFYDTQAQTQNPRVANDAMLVQNDSVDLYDIMDQIIAAEDTTAYNYLLDLMFTVNPIEDVDFDSENATQELASRTYYYDESTEDKLEKRVIEGRTIFSLPTLKVTEEHEKRKSGKDDYKVDYNKSLLEPTYTVYFETGKSELKEKYHSDLNTVLDALKKHEVLGVEISGYASKIGDEDYNRKLSNERAGEVLDYFNFKGIVRRRIVAKGYGTTGATGSSEESQKVEIRLVDLNEI
ncbi:MAG: OmpA family protein [Bacteroidota bacterium]